MRKFRPVGPQFLGVHEVCKNRPRQRQNMRSFAISAQKKAVADTTALKFAANYLKNNLDFTYGLRFLSKASPPSPSRTIVAGSGTQIVSITNSSM